MHSTYSKEDVIDLLEGNKAAKTYCEGSSYNDVIVDQYNWLVALAQNVTVEHFRNTIYFDNFAKFICNLEKELGTTLFYLFSDNEKLFVTIYKNDEIKKVMELDK